MLFKLSNLNSNLALTLGYLNPALNNSAPGVKDAQSYRFFHEPTLTSLQRTLDIDEEAFR